jgi:hypothetical protein
MSQPTHWTVWRLTTLIKRLVDGQIVRTASGQLLRRARAGARDLAHPMTPANARLFSLRPAEA